MAENKLKFQLTWVGESPTPATEWSAFLAQHQTEIVYFKSVDEALEHVTKTRGKSAGMLISVAIDATRVTAIKSALQGVPVDALNGQTPDEKFREAHYSTIIRPRLDALIEQEDLLASFAEDIFPLLEKLEGMVTSIDGGERSREALSGYMRILHTIKGTSASIGFAKVAEFAHKYEDFVASMQRGEREFGDEGAQRISKGYDQIKKMVYEAMNGLLDDGASDAVTALFSEPLAKADALKNPQGDAHGKEPAAVQSNAVADEKIFVSLEVLNEFIDASSRLITIRSTFQQAIDRLLEKQPFDLDVRSMQATSRQFDKEITKLQSMAEDLRRISLSNVFRPLKRMVREVAKSLGKKVRLNIDGEDLSIDRTVATILSNCLVHMLRNCVDHGIETPEERVPSGKPEEGTIQIVVREHEGYVMIDIQDDGKGINAQIVSRKALQLGLYTEEQLAKMSENEIQTIIFAPGFSTAARVSDISGRGVGTDMVKRTIEEAGGRLKLASKVGQGTKFSMAIPIPNNTLVLNVLLVQIGANIFALNRDEVVTILSHRLSLARHNLLSMSGGELTVQYLDEYYPVEDPGLGLNRGPDWQVTEEACVILLRHDQRLFAIFVDDVIGNEDCIGINLDKYAAEGLRTFAKATLLGNRKVALLADGATLLRLATSQISADESPLRSVSNG